jgi:hypothetical protein
MAETPKLVSSLNLEPTPYQMNGHMSSNSLILGVKHSNSSYIPLPAFYRSSWAVAVNSARFFRSSDPRYPFLCFNYKL